jgi:hypothetical protein
VFALQFRQALACLVPALVLPALAAAATPVLHGVAVDERLDGPATLASVAPAPAGGASLPLIARIAIDEAAFRGSGSGAAFDRLDARLSLYRSRGISIVIAFGALPSTDADVESWRQAVRSIVARGRGRVAGYQFGEFAGDARPATGRYAYLIKLASTQVRSIDASALVVQGQIPLSAADWLSALYREGVAPYVDAVAVAAPASLGGRAALSGAEAVGAVVTKEDPSAFLVLAPRTLPNQPAPATAELVDAALSALGTKVEVCVFRGADAALAAGLTAMSRLGDLFDGDLVGLDASGVNVFRGAADVSADVPHRLLYSPSRSDTYLVYWSGSGQPVRLVVDVSISDPAVRDPVTGATERVRDVSAEGRSTQLTVRAADHPLVLDFNFGAPARSSVVEAREEVLPSVEEIIAKAQQVQTAQDAAVKSYVAHSRRALHFRPSPAESAWNVVTENRLFSDVTGQEWAEESFAVNGATWTKNRPPFPLLQPEKVLSRPLDLRLGQDYRYKLDGIEAVDGRSAFVVHFEPADEVKALYRGTVWIDRSSFARLRISAVQTRSSGVVTSNEEEQVLTEVGQIDGQPIWLPTSLNSKQTVLIAGRSVPVEQEVSMTDVRLNVPDFDNSRAEVRAGDQIMYRDTDKGIRYFVKQGTTRTVSDTLTTSSRAFAMGADIDPSFDYPLPIAGLDILDFNFMHRDMQLALLFGGVIAVGNIQKVGIGGSRVDASVDFFGLAVKSNDSVFDAQGERRGERVETLPASTGFNVGYRIGSFQKISGRYELRFDAYFRDADTAEDFATPSSTATNGEGLSYEYRRRGYSFVGDATAYQRSTWEPWGATATFDPATRTYDKYDLGLSKDFVFQTFHTIHVNGQYFGGQRLDRFSMYQFGMFDATRMHGVPSAVRFAELAMFRGSYSFNVFDQYRLELFLDQAVGRNPDLAAGWQSVTGLGVGVNLRGPRSTILRGDIGWSRLPEFYRGAGSTVVQLMILKPL